jgi:hypothetical protein
MCVEVADRTWKNPDISISQEVKNVQKDVAGSPSVTAVERNPENQQPQRGLRLLGSLQRIKEDGENRKTTGGKLSLLKPFLCLLKEVLKLCLQELKKISKRR